MSLRAFPRVAHGLYSVLVKPKSETLTRASTFAMGVDTGPLAVRIDVLDLYCMATTESYGVRPEELNGAIGEGQLGRRVNFAQRQ